MKRSVLCNCYRTLASMGSSQTRASNKEAAHRRTVEMEKQLLRFFSGTGCSVQEELKTLSPVMWQLRTVHDAEAVTRRMLFPSAASLPLAANICSTAPARVETRRIDDKSQCKEPCVHGKVDCSSMPSALPVADVSVRTTESLRALGKKAKLREALEYRFLTSGFFNLFDGVKAFGDAEANFATVAKDVSSVLREAEEACRCLEVSRSSGAATTLPDCVVFLVLFSHTRRARGVGDGMLAIRRKVVQAIHGSSRYPSVLRVVTIGVGIQESDEAKSVGQGTLDELWYPRSGMYTLNAVLQCLRQLPSATSNCAGLYVPHRRVVVMSEAWLQPRTVVSIHGGNIRGRRGSKSHVPDVHMEVMPAVVTERLSEKEKDAFARYVVCHVAAES